jgi:hypothetical protein
MKLQIYYPTKPFYVTQKFGEVASLDYYKNNNVLVVGHNGMDLRAKHGDPIYAAHDGEAWYEIDGKQGHGVVLRTSEKFDYESGRCYFKTIYWHLCDPIKEPKFKSPVLAYADLNKPGMKVKAGDVIGYADSTGLSTGDHLHFGIKPVAKNEKNGSFYNAKQENGYYGAIDPEPFLNGKYASDINGFKPSTVHFLKDMKLSDTGVEIARLQSVLKELGYFPISQECTGYYGEITRNAVFHFQQDHVTLTPWEILWSKGSSFGPKSRAVINNLLDKYQVI